MKRKPTIKDSLLYGWLAPLEPSPVRDVCAAALWVLSLVNVLKAFDQDSSCLR